MSELKDFRRETSYCQACPKLCRFSCPVSNADKKESHTPWGKMTAAWHHLTETRPLDDDTGKALYACTGCMRCRTNCRHGNETGMALFAARQEAVDTGMAPAAIDALKVKFNAGNPFGEDLAPKVEPFARLGKAGGAAYFPGCTALARNPDVVKDALDASAGFGVKLSMSPLSSKCCGYPLWAAGLMREFEAHAESFARELESTPELVMGDPGCAYTLVKGYEQVGVKLSTKVTLLVDVLAERMEFAIGRAPLPLNASYHDACKLGRGLGCYESPRRLLKAAVGDFFEAAENRADGGCSGGGGVLPLTMPETSLQMAKDQAAEQGAPNHAIVTACPTARRQFTKAGAEAHDLFSVLAKWMRTGGR